MHRVVTPIAAAGLVIIGLTGIIVTAAAYLHPVVPAGTAPSSGMMMGRGYGYGMMGGYGWFGALLMFFFGALVIAGIVLLIVWAVKASTHHLSAGRPTLPPGAAGHDEAVAIAKRRLASGEINKDQYDEIMRALGG